MNYSAVLICSMSLFFLGCYVRKQFSTDKWFAKKDILYTFYFSDEMPDKIIVRNQVNYDDESGYELVGSLDNVFIEFDEQLNNQLYKKNAEKFNEVNDGVNYIDLVLKENYAIDKNGVHIE